MSEIMVEHELKANLRACAVSYAASRGIEVSTLGRLAAGDWRFFDRLGQDDRTFTARKYDEVMAWFSNHWPAELPWPSRVERPDDAQEPERQAS